MKTYDPYTKYHGQLDLTKMVPSYRPLMEPEWRQGYDRLTHQHVRKTTMASRDLLTGEQTVRDNPLPAEFKSILELSTRAPYCVVEGTKILVPPERDNKTGRWRKGFTVKPVEKITEGDMVVGYEVDENRFVFNKVVSVLQRESCCLLVKLENRNIKCSEDHPFYTKNRGWVSAFDLIVGDKILYYFGRDSKRGSRNPAKRLEVREKISKTVKGHWKNGIYSYEIFKDPIRMEKIREALRKGKYKKCEYCGREFWVPECLLDYNKFCSVECYHSFLKSPRGSETRSGENNPNWRGGISREPYGEEFNEPLREEVRGLWGNRCVLCDGEETAEEKLSVHHINYDKTDNKMENLVPLHRKCHLVTNFNRNRWQTFFEEKVAEVLDPDWMEVMSVDEVGLEKVYNFETDGTHTYFAEGLLSHNCPVPFVLDTMMGVCQFNCLYCFSALSVSSLMTSFFDSDNPLRPRYANPDYVTKVLDETLKARGTEPYERSRKAGEGQACKSTNDPSSLKKAAAQRIPLRIGTRSECFLSAEREKGSSLAALKVIRDHEYPAIINTKSDLIIEEPYLSLIGEMGDHIAIQVSIIHDDNAVAKRLEPGAPPSSKRWEVLKTFNDMGILAMPRMEPSAVFLNNDDEHLTSYFDHAVEAGVQAYMGDTYHYTVKAQEVREMFYRAEIDFDRMWEATTEWQILGSYSFEKTMYYAKQRGIKAGTFNFHSLPWNDDPVCCMVGDKFGSWNKYSLVNFLRNELVERGKVSFEELDQKYYGYELHPLYRQRIKDVWNMKHLSGWNPDWMEGAYIHSEDGEGNLTWAFDSNRMGEWYENLIAMFGGKRNG